MSTDPEVYFAILKASYAYSPQSEDEIEIFEDQILLLIEKMDEECVVVVSLPVDPCSFRFYPAGGR